MSTTIHADVTIPAATVITATITFGYLGPGAEAVTDHGELDGLGDDDHTQYHTDERGDLRYDALGAAAAAQAAAVQRANHTGTQAISTVADLETQLAARPLTTEMDTAIAAAITALIGGAPGALDTLNELAAALGDDEAFATSVTNALAAKGGLAANNTWTGTNQFVDGFQWTDATIFDVSEGARDNFAAAVGSTAGALLLRLANPAEASYLRVNADGTLTPLTAAQVWTALGGSGTIGSPSFGVWGISSAAIARYPHVALYTGSGFTGSVPGVRLSSSGGIMWSGGDYLGSPDASITRISTSLVGVGTGAAGSFAGSLKCTNAEMVGVTTLGNFTVGTVPAAATYPRGVIYVSDDVGGATLAFSDGTDWRRVQDRAVITT